jgi:aspartate/methionine/tyrosine aminotransferase
MTMAVSTRARGVVASTYAEFPLPPAAIDLRGDRGPSPVAPLIQNAWEQTGPTLRHLDVYSAPQGLASLRNDIASRFAVPPEDVLITAGASEAIMIALLLVADPGEAVALSRPGFPGYEQLARCLGLNILPYDPATGLAPSTVRPSAVVVVTPHNPTGLTLPLATPVARRGSRLWIVRDVSHSLEPLLDGCPAASEEQEVVIFSFSKGLRLPGLRLGCLIASHTEAIRAALAIKTHLSMAASLPAQHLLLRILREPQLPELIKAQEQLYANNREVLTNAINLAKSLELIGGEAGTHLLVTGQAGEDDQRLWSRLRDAGVIGLPGAVFSAPYPCVRLSYGQSPAEVEAAAIGISGL